MVANISMVTASKTSSDQTTLSKFYFSFLEKNSNFHDVNILTPIKSINLRTMAKNFKSESRTQFGSNPQNCTFSTETCGGCFLRECWLREIASRRLKISTTTAFTQL